MSQKPPTGQPEEATLTVQLTVSELSALSIVVMTPISAVEQTVANAAERGYRKVREAAKRHPRTVVDKR